jgi:hypothetical protein
MKILPEHYGQIKQVFSQNKDKITSYRTTLLELAKPPKDLEMRLRWDAINVLLGSAWICHKIYPYANDTHLDSALKKIVEELNI